MEVGIMNFLKRWPLILVSFFFITNTAFAHPGAGFLIEPYLGYGFQIAGKDDPNKVEDTSYHGVDIGARIGFRLGRFMIGVDGDYMSAKVDYSTSGRADLKKYNFAAYAGLIFGDFSVRGSWIWTTNWDFKDNAALNGNYKGDGWGVGAGWKFLKYMAVNIDYRMYSLDGGFKPGELLFGISLPFDLGQMMYDEEHKHDEDNWWGN